MPHVADLRRLAQLHKLLGDALAKEDWPRIREIDLLIRQGLQRLDAEGALNPRTLNELAPLKARHGQALQACARDCQRLSALLASHTEHGEGRSAYSLVDSVQAEN